MVLAGIFRRLLKQGPNDFTLVLRRLEPEGAPARPVLEALTKGPPHTFHEALQLMYLHHELQEMGNGYSVRSMGRFDQLLNEFYTRDLQAGRLTREQAKELLKYFWVRFYAKTQGRMYGKPFLSGPEGNELVSLAFEVYREMQIVDPKFHFRLGERTHRELFEQVVGCVQPGCTGIVIVKDSAQVGKDVH